MEEGMLRCQGDHTGITIELKRYSKKMDENPELLMFMKLLNKHHCVSLRLFVLDCSIQVRKAHKVRTDDENRRCVRARTIATSRVITDQTARRPSSTSVVNLGLARSEYSR